MSNPNRKPYQTLSQAVEEMERTDPEVRALVEKQDWEDERDAMRRRIDERRAAEGKPPLRRGSS